MRAFLVSAIIAAIGAACDLKGQTEVMWVDSELDSSGLYDYRRGGQNWQELYPESVCGTGKMQSPIDLSDKLAIGSHNVAINLSGLAQVAKDPLPEEKDMETNWDVDFDGVSWAKTATLIRKDSSGVITEFNPLGVHLHTPAEHTVDGKLFDAEVHLVNQNEAGNLSVVGVFYDSARDQHSDFIQSLIDAYSTREKDEDQRQQVDMTKLFGYELTLREVWQYEGSLTTPPCTEGVAWNVVKQALPISKKQLETLKILTTRGKLLDTNRANPLHIGGNNRAVQPLNDRKISTFAQYQPPQQHQLYNAGLVQTYNSVYQPRVPPRPSPDYSGYQGW